MSAWHVMDEEYGGADPGKRWVAQTLEARSDEMWLWKPARRHTGGRPWITDDLSERIAYELAQLLGLPAAVADLAELGPVEGTLSRNLVPFGWSRREGDVLLSGIPGYVPMSQQEEMKPAQRSAAGYTLDNVLAVLAGMSGPPGTACETWAAAEVFAGYLVFDAWTANTDRHARNWLVIESDAGERRLGPSFDHGTVLGSGMDDAALVRKVGDIVSWCNRGAARAFEGSPKLVGLATDAVSAAGGRAGSWLERLAAVGPSDWQGIMESMPGMSEPARTFSERVLSVNRERLLS